jgi:hypothetical protein
MLVAEQTSRLGQIMITFGPRLRRFLLAFIGGAPLALAIAFPAVAGAAPCINDTAGNPNKCCVKIGDAPGPGPDCVSDDMQNDGLLGDVPVVGNLPGVGGVL